MMAKVAGIMSIIRGLSEAKENNGLEPRTKVKPEDQDFSDVSQRISTLTAEELEHFEAKLIKFVVREWEDATNNCFVTLDFIADIFLYICTVTGPDAVDRYSYFFSLPVMPLHVQLVLYPAVASLKLNDDSVVGFEQKLRDLNEWDWTCVTEYLAHQHSLKAAFELNEQFLIRICQLLVDRLQPNTDITLILAALFLVTLRSIPPLNSLALAEVARLINSLHSELSHSSNPSLIAFVKTSIRSFLNTVPLDDERWLESLQCVTGSRTVPSPRARQVLFKTEPTLPPRPSKDNCLQPSSRFAVEKEVTAKRPVHSNIANNATASSSEIKTTSSNVAAASSSIQSNNTCSNAAASSTSNGQSINNASTSSSQPTNGGTKGGGVDKMLELLEKLVSKMKNSNVKLTAESEKERLRGCIRDLSDFL